MQKIILVGYMAVGKSTVAEILSERTGIKWLDLDHIIEVNQNLSVSNIFKEKGEIYFRKQEHLELKQLVQSERSFILSTGGGTPCYSNNHMFLNINKVVSIYLSASIEEIFKRLKNNKSQRPLVSNLSDDDLKEFIAKNIFERSFYYNQATFKINTDHKSPEEIVEEIVGLLN